MKHTPGPWHTDESKSFYVFDSDNNMVCNGSTQANARLILAAPELLAALKICLPFIEETAMVYSEGSHGKRIYPAEIAAAAIAKAEGR